MDEISLVQKIAQLVNYRADQIENRIRTSIFGLSNDQEQIEKDILEIKEDLKSLKSMISLNSENTEMKE